MDWCYWTSSCSRATVAKKADGRCTLRIDGYVVFADMPFDLVAWYLQQEFPHIVETAKRRKVTT